MTSIADTLNRMPLRNRLLVAPLLGVILLVTLLAAFIYESQRQNGLLTDVAERHLAAFDSYSEVFVNLSAQHVALYDLLANAPDGDEKSFHLQAKPRLNAVYATLAKLEGALGGETGNRTAEFVALRRDLLVLMQAYRQSIGAAAGTKPTSGMASLRTALINERFDAMNRSFLRLIDVQRRGLADDITAGVARNRTRGLMFAAAAISGALLLLMFSLALAKLLAHSLRTQITALSELGDMAADADGDEVQCIARAISTFRDTQTALRASEQRFRLFFEHNNAVILLIDPEDGSIRDANESASRFYGYTRAALCAMTIQQINQMPPEDVAAERENAQLQLRNYFIFPHRLADGRVRSVEVHATPIEVDGKLLLFSIVHDITERRNAEEELRLLNRDLEQRIADRTLALWNEKSLLRSLIDAVPDVITVKDAAGRYLACNRAFAHSVAGRQEQEVLGSRTADLLPADQAAAFDEIERMVMSTGTPHKEERTVRFADGRHVLLELIKTPFYDHDHKIIGTIGIGHDVTERYQREQTLREAQSAADAANRAKSAFLAAMSHEIRTPMHGVVGMIELIGETAHDAKQKAMVDTARNSAFALLRIIDDILDFSKIEAGKLTIEHIPVSMQEIAEGVVNMLAPVAAKAGIRLLLHYDPALPAAILGDQVRLTQILVNLASNAIKFSRASDNAQVAIRAEREVNAGEPAQLRLSVRDHGIGMTAKQIDDLFQPFCQADISTTRRFGGTGLGLTICKRLVDQMGGAIQVDSTPGAGSTFIVRLPLVSAPSAAARTRPPDLAGPKTADLDNSPDKLPNMALVAAPSVDQAEAEGHLVLVAEDNEINRSVISRQLDLLGYAALIARDGRAALELLRTRRFGLLLTDCHMPEMDGFQLTQAIRMKEEAGGRRLPIVAITANAMRGEANRCLAAGMDAFISKPFELRELQRMLAQWLPRIGAVATAAAVAEPAGESSSLAPVDFSVLKKLVGDDPAIHAQLLDKFVATSARVLAEMHAAATAGRLDDVAAAAHKLKSSCRSIGSAAPGNVSAALEAAGAAGDATEVRIQLDRLDGLMSTVFGYLRALKDEAHRIPS